MRHTFGVVVVLGFYWLLSPPCRADEDGFFCTSKGYLAYNLRGGSTPGLTGHIVKVVRFDSKGIYFAGKVNLQDFQVHRMKCERERIEISGYGNIFKQYEIKISGPQSPRIANFMQDPARHFDTQKDGPEPLWFSQGQSGTQVVALDSDGSEARYKLLLTHKANAVKGAVKHRNTAEIVRASPDGKILQRLVLYVGRSTETID
jgi:hypothetical protein